MSAGYIKKIPFPEAATSDERLCVLAQHAFQNKKSVIQNYVGEFQFSYPEIKGSFLEYSKEFLREHFAREMERLRIEYEIEKRVQELLELSARQLQEIEKKLGYRFVIKGSKYKDDYIYFKVANVGWGKSFKSRGVSIKIKDNFTDILPAITYLFLSVMIFYNSIII